MQLQCSHVNIGSCVLQIWQKHAGNHCGEMYVEFFHEVVHRTAALVAQWQCVGFCHG